MTKTSQKEDTALEKLIIQCCRMSNQELPHMIFSVPNLTFDFLDTTYGMSPVMHAAFFNNAITLQELLKRGANPNLTDNIGYTALHYAVTSESQDCDSLKLVTPELLATLRQAMVRDLLQFGANVDMRDYQGNTPLHLALINDNIPLAIQLIKDGNANPILRNHEGVSPFQLVQVNMGKFTEMHKLALDCIPTMAESLSQLSKRYAELYTMMAELACVKALDTAQTMMNGSVALAQHMREGKEITLPMDICKKILAHMVPEIPERLAAGLAGELLTQQQESKEKNLQRNPEELTSRKEAKKLSFTEKYLQATRSSVKGISSL